VLEKHTILELATKNNHGNYGGIIKSQHLIRLLLNGA
jgi:hypothetical protein